MKWEYMEQQDLPVRKNTTHLFHPQMWRAHVPGGWLILQASGSDVKGPYFYPDADHVWSLAEQAKDSATYLLRPASGKESETP